MPYQTATPIVEAVKEACKTSVNSFTFQITLVVSVIYLFVNVFIAASIHKFGPNIVLRMILLQLTKLNFS